MADSFKTFIDRAFWTVLIGLIGFAVNFLAQLSGSVNVLNERVGIVIERVANQETRIQRLEFLKQR